MLFFFIKIHFFVLLFFPYTKNFKLEINLSVIISKLGKSFIGFVNLSLVLWDTSEA